jgi:transcriptional regulator with XRE-family HTH domain
MTDTTVGRLIRAARVRRAWRQVDLARRARVSTSTVSRLERGDFGAVSLERLRRVFVALGGRLDVVPRFEGGEVDRLLNARHAAMHELMARRFRIAPGWEFAPEVSFSIYGERGVIDVLAWHAATRTLLIVELKTEIVDVNELMAKADQRRRLAVQVAAQRGWHPATVGVWVVVADSRTNRRRLAAHRAVLRAAFPTDGRSVDAWIRRPRGPLAALSFLSNGHPLNARASLATARRCRLPRSRTRDRSTSGQPATT